jgi:hypothetical protein
VTDTTGAVWGFRARATDDGEIIGSDLDPS